VITGKQPASLSEEDIIKTDEAEARLFQRSLYNNILLKANSGKYAMNVTVQPHDNTISMLQANGISVREAWKASDETLCKALGVDAVVDMGTRVLNSIVKPVNQIPSMTKTNDIIASCALVSNGETLCNDNYQRAADWSSPANLIIENITKKFAKHFPYSKKR
jgi:hypothetical protein